MITVLIFFAVNTFYPIEATTAIHIEIDTKGLMNDSVMGEIFFGRYSNRASERGLSGEVGV
jgi:hypothetical protein